MLLAVRLRLSKSMSVKPVSLVLVAGLPYVDECEVRQEHAEEWEARGAWS